MRAGKLGFDDDLQPSLSNTASQPLPGVSCLLEAAGKLPFTTTGRLLGKTSTAQLINMRYQQVSGHLTSSTSPGLWHHDFYSSTALKCS